MSTVKKIIIIAFVLLSSSVSNLLSQSAVVGSANTILPRPNGITASDIKFGYPISTFPPDTSIQIHHKDVIGTWFVAPVSGTIDTIYWYCNGSVGAQDSTIFVRIHQSNISDAYGPGVSGYVAYPPPQSWGYWKSTTDADNNIAAFIDDINPDEDTTWYSTIAAGPETERPFGMELFGNGIGLPVKMSPFETSIANIRFGGIQLEKGQSFFISFRPRFQNQHIVNDTISTDFAASHTDVSNPSHAWVFYEHDSAGSPESKKGWHAIGGVNLNIWYKMTFESGSFPNGLLSGEIFNDLNWNGIRDIGEPGISNWQINLSGKKNASTITDINGDYKFAFLDSGSYIITEEQKPGWMQIFPPSGSHNITLGVDDTLNGLDFGNIELNTILMRKYRDADGDFSTTNDRSPHLWSMGLYKDSISTNSLITSVPSNTTLLANNLMAGTYIAVEADSARWLSLGKISDGISYAGTFNADTIILSTGQTKTIDFVNYQPRIVVKKKADTDGNFTTTADRYPKLWSLSVFRDSVSETNLVSRVASADSLVVYSPEPGNYCS